MTLPKGPHSTKKKQIWVFALASFLNDFGSDIIYPIWPLFVTSVMGANMVVLGFLDGLGDATVSLSQAASGYISDKIQKRKVWIWLGYLLGSASRLGYAVSTTWHHLIPFRILDRAGKIRSAPRDAAVADLSTENERGKHFGFLRMMDHLGAVCGIVFCLVFFGLGYRTLFAIAAVPSLIAVLLIVLFVVDRPFAATRAFRGISLRHISKNFWLFTASSALFAVAGFSYSFLLIYAAQRGAVQSTIPIFYLLFTLVAAVSSLPFGHLSDRWGKKRLIAASYVFWGLTCFALLAETSIIGAVVCFVLYGLHKGALEPVQKAFVSALAPAEYRASALGGFQMVIGLCAFPSSVIAGFLWEEVGVLAPLYFSLVLTILSTGILLFVHEKTEDNPN